MRFVGGRGQRRLHGADRRRGETEQTHGTLEEIVLDGRSMKFPLAGRTLFCLLLALPPPPPGLLCCRDMPRKNIARTLPPPPPLQPCATLVPLSGKSRIFAAISTSRTSAALFFRPFACFSSFVYTVYSLYFFGPCSSAPVITAVVTFSC